VKKADGRASGAPRQADPVDAIVASILGVVPASYWAFARVASDGELEAVRGADLAASGLAELADELKRQRRKSAAGPRISATLGPLAAFASGMTLVFADARATYGILELLRTADLGPFTSSEISMLTFALEAVSDGLSALSLRPDSGPAEPERLPASAEGAFYVLDGDFNIVLGWSSGVKRHVASTGLPTCRGDHLPMLLEQTVRDLTAAWANGAVKKPGVAHPVPFLVVRTHPMTGPAGVFVGVHVDCYRPPNSLIGASTRFHITPREIQVLALLLDGQHLDAIAEQLFITSSTVQDHIKSMLDKTESRNRSELIARILGWRSEPHARAT
jgi:DNA-binding CsgD family transcriptional regulator